MLGVGHDSPLRKSTRQPHECEPHDYKVYAGGSRNKYFLCAQRDMSYFLSHWFARIVQDLEFAEIGSLTSEFQ